MSHLLEVRNLTVSYGRHSTAKKVVSDASILVETGQITAVMGETGSGKSTIGKGILRLLGADGQIMSGEILLQGKEITTMPEKDFAAYRGRVMSTVPQNPYLALNPVMRCGRQVEEVLLLQKKLNKSQVKKEVISLFTDMHLDDPERIYRSYPHSASIGELQRVCIAMALAASPQLLIADEPFSSVDPVNRLLLADLFRQVVSERKVGILLISHKIEMVDLLADRWYLLHSGKVVEEGIGSFSSSTHQDHYAKKLAEDYAAMRRIALSEKARNDLLFKVVDLRVDFQSPTFLRLKSHTSKSALEGVSFEVSSGETLGIVGRSGSGKSTLAKVLGGLLTLYCGDAYLRSNEIGKWVRSDRRSYYRQVQYLMQDAGSSLPPRRKIGKVMIDTLSAFHPASRSEQQSKALELLSSVELGPQVFAKSRDELSGGEQQRVSIARALAAQPSVLILDESLNSLDKTTQRQILELLKSLQLRHKLTLILISHDITLISHLCSRIIVLHEGRIAEIGATDDILRDPAEQITSELLKAQG